MKSFILTLLPALLVAASPQSYSSGQSQDIENCLSKSDAQSIVDQYISVLQQKPYQGKTPEQTAEDLVIFDYQVQSDSVRSLLKEPIDGTLDAYNRTQWVNGLVMANKLQPPPYAELQTTTVLRGEDNTIFWSWKLLKVGQATYPVAGVQILYLNDNKQITKSYFEFNSIAWGANTGQIEEYCSDGANQTSSSQQ